MDEPGQGKSLILVLTDLFPTESSPNSGIFVTKRIEALERLGRPCTPIALSISLSPLRIRMKRRRGIPVPDPLRLARIPAPDSTVVYTVVEVHLGYLDSIGIRLRGPAHVSWKAYRALYRRIGRIDCDVVHAHWLHVIGGAALRYARRIGRPCVVTCHGSDVHTLLREPGNRRDMRRTLREADAVEFVSEALRETAAGYGPIRNPTVVPNGIDRLPATEPKTRVSETWTVGFVGGFLPVKGADRLDAIVRRILAGSPRPVRFLAIGEGPLREEQERRLSGIPAEFPGFLPHDDVLAQMAGMDVLMVPSRNEGWPCVILEAHASGVPVVGSDRGGIPEAVGDDRFIVADRGEGLDAEEAFATDFAERVLRVLDGRIAIDRAALAARSAGFTWDALARRTDATYRAIGERSCR